LEMQKIHGGESPHKKTRHRAHFSPSRG